MILLSNDDMGILICSRFMSLAEYLQLYTGEMNVDREQEFNYPLPPSFFHIMEFLEVENYNKFGVSWSMIILIITRNPTLTNLCKNFCWEDEIEIEINILIIYTYKISLMRNLFILLVLSVWMTTAASWSNFCSVMCGTSCSGDLKINCNTCQSDGAWIKSGNTCVVKTSAGWNYLDGTSDLGGTLTVTGATLSAFCYSFNLFGYANPASQIAVSTPGITVPYYSMKMYVGILAHNSVCSNCGAIKYVWQASTQIKVQFSDPLGTIAPSSNPLVYTIGTSPATVSGKCDNSQQIKSQWYRVSKQYTYNAMNTLLSWTFSVD